MTLKSKLRAATAGLHLLSVRLSLCDFSAMSARATVCAAFGLLAAGCSSAHAPPDPGVCWRASQIGGAVHFALLARGVDTLESCALLLEGLRLQGARISDGAYQGYFIFVDDTAISSARSPEGLRYPIFQPPQRADLDRDLRRLMNERGGRLPDPSTLTVERK
jgi:hypothetical protein